MERTYISIDLKSYYASVECVHRGLNPLQAMLLVADSSRTDKTICLSVSPALKAIGVPGRPRLFEAKQKIQEYEIQHHTKVNYIIAVPRMAEYERISAKIYGIYLRYVSQEDIHIYSIDECFIDCTAYLHAYQKEARKNGLSAARLMAITMIRAVLKETGITATVGIGTNLYLAKIAMDIVAKKAQADRDGVRIAELNEDSYKILLWGHKPLTDFWQIGRGKAKRLADAAMYTMGDIAARTQRDEEFFYKTFGVDGEIIIDHAWGVEPVTMKDIKSYRSEGHSLSNGQVLQKPYRYEEARLVFREMIEALSTELFTKNLVTSACSWWVSYDHTSLEVCPGYDGPLSIDFYGRFLPKHSVGTVKLAAQTNHLQQLMVPMVRQFDEKTNHKLLYRKLCVCANELTADMGTDQMSLFTDYINLEKDRQLQKAMLEVRKKFGMNAIFKGLNMMEGATALERNQQIGGHKA